MRVKSFNEFQQADLVHMKCIMETIAIRLNKGFKAGKKKKLVKINIYIFSSVRAEVLCLYQVDVGIW